MELKKKICLSCQTSQYIFSQGKCRTCWGKCQKPMQRSAIQQKSYRIKRQTQKNREKRISQSAIRDKYFEYHIDLCKFSEESGVMIYPTRANICHLFDKARHPSLQGNLENYLYLTLEEHTQFDRLLYNHDFRQLELKFKKSWKIACERMKNLLPLCMEKTKFYILIEEYLNNESKTS